MKTETTNYQELATQPVLTPRYTIGLNFHNDNLVPDYNFTEKANGEDSYWNTRAQAVEGLHALWG